MRMEIYFKLAVYFTVWAQITWILRRFLVKKLGILSVNAENCFLTGLLIVK